jgi:hypothetical protein
MSPKRRRRRSVDESDSEHEAEAAFEGHEVHADIQGTKMEDGPASMQEAMHISDRLQTQLRVKGVKLFGADFEHELKNLLATCSARVSTDYSGIGTAEIAVRNICLVASAIGLVFDVKRIHACDLLQDCRFMLLHHRDGDFLSSSVSAPTCVFSETSCIGAQSISGAGMTSCS